MLFSSLVFIFAFLPVALLLWNGALAAGRPRLAVGLAVAASLFFYGWWNFQVFWVLLLSIAVNYGLGGAIIALPASRRRTALLVGGLAFNLGLLGWFKYAGFLENLFHASTFRDLTSTVANAALPLGISFFTFQKIAYLVDCWKKPPARNYSPLDYAFFVTFFPQLIAGPIVHHSEIIPQLWRLHGRAAWKRAGALMPLGFGLFTIGLAKKMLLADSFGRFATNAFAGAAGSGFTILDAWGGASAYTLQIYFDFSGYSDMAIGIALMFGIRLPLNFLSPYQAPSIIEFWRRWHMTLSRFLRDYLYVPLGGNRKGPVRRHLNLLATMALGGLWHGPSLTFVFWGVLHGSYLILNHLWQSLSPWRLPPVLGRALTFLAVLVAWVPFRAANLADTFTFYRSLLGLGDSMVLPASYVALLGRLLGGAPAWIRTGDIYYFAGAQQIGLTALGLAIVFFLPSSARLLSHRPARRALARPLTAFALGAAFWASLLMLFVQDSATFLYFQF